MKRIIATVLCLIFALSIPCHAGIFDFLKSPEDKLKDELQESFTQNKQSIFKEFHPVGTATKVVVHEVKIEWKSGRPSNNLDNAAGFGVVFTVYWRGPITTDGFTKAFGIFDNDSKRYVKWEIISTNGTTNEQAADVAGEVLGSLINNYFQNQR